MSGDPTPAPALAERVEAALAWREPVLTGEDLMYGSRPHWMTPPPYRALLAEVAAALAAAEAREARVREALGILHADLISDRTYMRTVEDTNRESGDIETAVRANVRVQVLDRIIPRLAALERP